MPAGGAGAGAGRGGGEVGRGQGVGVELAVGGQRERVDADADGGDHVVGQVRGGVGAQFRGVGRHLPGGHRVGDELPGSVVGPAYDNGGPGDLRVGGEDGFDLARLDAEAAQLDLLVRPAQVFEGAVGAAARQVAGAVHPAAGRSEGVVEEPLGGQFGSAEVPGGHAGAGHVHLADGARRHGPARGVEQVHPQVRQRPADDARPALVRQIGRGDAVVGDVHGGLGDAVHVHQCRALETVPVGPGPQALGTQGLTAEDDVAQGARAVRTGSGRLLAVGLHELLEGGRRLVEHGHALTVQQSQEVVG